uniref:phosphoglucomutase (alpha-D-glucose-1,6-bisphosphate-dependent) n=1 Tax=Halomonas sp. TaxID=1486246 RepID=UPI00260CF402|nr:phosphoglucomutase (alpha-D-glucose-1,6-bisphosphate-dependent) [Halomonas sp.]
MTMSDNSIDALLAAYHDITPDITDPAQKVSFGTSGHRGTALSGSFNDAHIAAIAQAVADYRRQAGIDGPLFLGRDTHALSRPAWETTLQVLAANQVDTVIAENDEVLATPVISHAILRHNAERTESLADGLIITPSHNPPQDGGIKYNPTHGGPAEGDITSWIEQRANQYLADGGKGIQRQDQASALDKARSQDLIGDYVATLGDVIDMAAIRASNLRLGADPMGGTALPIWQAIAKRYDLQLEVVNTQVDSSFSFMPPDHDGKIRMDCSSPAAMANLLAIKDRFDLAFGNDPDADRHGIVDAAGLMNPNHYLAVAIDYLLTHRPQWSADLKVGKTLVSSSMIDRVVAAHDRPLHEVPVGFKWFVEGLHQGWLAFGGEESAGASLLTHTGSAWSTDKDGIALCLLAAEITAVTGEIPSQRYAALTAAHGAPVYRRIDTPCDIEQKAAFKSLNASSINTPTLAGDPIETILTEAPGNGASIGGIKVTTANGWFAARPSGTEALYKLYAESFKGEAHLDVLIADAQTLLDNSL